MRRRLLASLCVGVLPLTACQSGGPFSSGSAAPPSLVPVSAIVNGIKCELAQTFANGDYLDAVVKQDKDGADIAGSLVLANVVARAQSAEGGVEIPLAVVVGPSLSAGKTDTATQAFELKFSYDVDKGHAVPAFCSDPTENVAQVEGDPFIDMLKGVVEEYGKIERADPKVKLASIGYTSKFEVKKEVGGGVKLKFLFFSLGGKASRADTSVQSLAMTFNLNLEAAVFSAFK